MTKTTTLLTSTPLPKLDLDALVDTAEANIETVVAAQKIMFDLVQTVAKKQVEIIKEAMTKADDDVQGLRLQKQPQAYAEEVRPRLRRPWPTSRRPWTSASRRNEVVDLFVKRATANFEEHEGRRRLT